MEKEFEQILFNKLKDLTYQYDWLSDKITILIRDFDYSRIKKILNSLSIYDFESCLLFNTSIFDVAISFNHSFIDKNYLSSIKGIQKYNL